MNQKHDDTEPTGFSQHLMQQMTELQQAEIRQKIEERLSHIDDTSAANSIWGNMQALRAQLQEARPQERGELSRRYAIVITDLEKTMGYFDTFIRAEFMMDK